MGADSTFEGGGKRNRASKRRKILGGEKGRSGAKRDKRGPESPRKKKHEQNR